MRKIYSFAIAMSVACGAFAQHAVTKTVPFKNNTALQTVKPIQQQSKMTTIWSNDFTDPADWSSTTNPVNGDMWTIGTAVPSGTFPINPIASTNVQEVKMLH